MGPPSAGLLLSHIGGFLLELDSGVGGTLLLPWGLEEQELSRVQAWAASVPQDPKEAPRDVLLSSLLAVSAAQTGAHTVMAKTQLPGVGSCLYHKDSSNN